MYVNVLYLLYQYIEIVGVLVHHVIIVILNVLSTFRHSLGKTSSQAIPVLTSMGVILRAPMCCRQTSRVSRVG